MCVCVGGGQVSHVHMYSPQLYIGDKNPCSDEHHFLLALEFLDFAYPVSGMCVTKRELVGMVYSPSGQEQ